MALHRFGVDFFYRLKDAYTVHGRNMGGGWSGMGVITLTQNIHLPPMDNIFSLED